MTKKTNTGVAGKMVMTIVLPAALTILMFACKGQSDRSGIRLPEPPPDVKLSGPVEKQIRTALEETVKNPVAENLGQLGMIYHSNAFYPEARASYLLAAQANPDDWRWHYYLGYLYSELGETDSAVASYKKVTSLNPEASFATYYLSEAYIKLGNTARAEMLLTKLLSSPEQDPNTEESVSSSLYPLAVYVQLSLARLYMNTSRMDSAIMVLQPIIRDYPDYGPAYRLLANIYGQQGKEKLSTENSQRANELCQFIPIVDPRIAQLAILSRSDEYILKQIDLAAFTSNQEWAKKLLDHAMVFMPDNPFLISKSIQFYILYGFGDDINRKIDLHYSAFSDDFNELAKLATLFNKNGKYGWAILYYERCNQLKPDDFTILHNLAINYSNAGDLKVTDSLIRRLSGIRPGDTEFMADAASIYIRMGENGRALPIIRLLEELTPDDPVINRLKAGIALNDKNMQSADDYYLKYLAKVPDDADAIQYLGQRYIETGSWNKAILHYKKALDYHPNNAVFIEKLGSLYYNSPDTRLRDPKKAGYYLERAYLSIKSSVETRITSGRNLAGVYAGEKNWQKAIAVINTTRILASRSRYPEQEIKEMTKTMEDYQIKSMSSI
jgi:tetratricopeptide (TPR) repeat protein